MEKLHGDNTKKTTVQDLIDMLQQVEDKSKIVYVWDQSGYCGTQVEIDFNPRYGDANMIMLESMED